MSVMLLNSYRFASTFDPTTISGCVLWLDASDTASITISSGSSVSQINDKSGVGNHATQSTGTKQPSTGTRTINSLNTLDFDGSSDVMDLANLMSGASAGTAFVVMQLDADPGAGAAVGAPLGAWGTDALQNHFPFSDGNIYEDFGTNARKSCGNPSTSMATSPVLVSMVSAASDWRLYINTVQLFSTGTNTVGWGSSPKIANDGSVYMDGRLAEVVAYTSALGTTDRQSVENYLKAKWATP